MDVEAERKLVRDEEIERIREEERAKARQELGMQYVASGSKDSDGDDPGVGDASGGQDSAGVPARSGPLGRSQEGGGERPDRPRPFHRR